MQAQVRGAMVLVALFSAATLEAQLDDTCVVSVLNRSVQVQPDGAWTLPTVPANIGRVRVRATCVESGLTRSGQSGWLLVPPNGVVQVPPISMATSDPVPSKLTLTAPETTLRLIGAALQLKATAAFSDGSERDVSTAATGTNYTSSNPRIASVSADGRVSAQSSGTAIVTALNDGASALLRVSVVLAGDSDGDGISDDVELANGLNPNDPVDALEDFDRDGLTNGDELNRGTQIRNADTDGDTLTDGREVALGTDPLRVDTDGDGIRDGLEVATGSDPLDPNSYNLGLALRAIEIAPASFALVVNTIIGEASRQLTVTGQLLDDTAIDLTSTRRGTNYSSSNLLVCNFGSPDGRVFAGADGACTVTATNSGFSASATGAVKTFSPIAHASLPIPGYANNVDARGGFAYVAAGATGLQVVDVSDPPRPAIVGSVDTPGNANDVRVVGSLAFVADGSAGLQIVDVSDPSSPTVIGHLDTPGEAQDVRVAGGRAFVADGASGLQIIDVSDPAQPTLLGAIDTSGTAKGVDVSGTLAAVADGAPSSALRIVDVSDPTRPRLLGSVSIPGDAKDLVVRETLAYVAAFTGGFRIVDLSVPTTPRVVGFLPGSSPSGFVPRDVEVSSPFALAAEQLFPNAVPIVDVVDPAAPSFRAVLDFSPLGDYAGTGLALDRGFVYMTGEFFIVGPENGSSGNTRLFVGQYLAEDAAGLAPTVTITSPAPESEVMEATTLRIKADAEDDVSVAGVSFLVDGEVVSTDTVAPYQLDYFVAKSSGTLRLGATASDLGGNVGVAADVVVTVVPDPPPTLTITSPGENATPIEGSLIVIAAEATDNVAVSSVVFTINDQPQPPDTVPPYALSFTVPTGLSTLSIEATATDNLGKTTTKTRTVPVVPDPPPVVTITSPAEGTTLFEGATIAVSAEATDNVAVTSVVFTLNGTAQPPLVRPPYTVTFKVPVGITALAIEATASDNLERATTVSRMLSVVPDPLTTVEGRVEDADGSAVSGATLSTLGGRSAVSRPDGSFTIESVPTVEGDLVVRASLLLPNGRVLNGRSVPTPPVPGGTTNVGTIVVTPAAFEEELGVRLNLGDDDCECLEFETDFRFPFFGATRRDVRISSNGRLLFQFTDRTGEESLSEFNEQPQIALLFDDLGPHEEGDPDDLGVFVNEFPNRFVVTYNRVKEHGGDGSNTMQAILFDDGRIQIGYDGMTASDGIVGITPGFAANLQEVDFSAAGPFGTVGPVPIFEQFTASGEADFYRFAADAGDEVTLTARSFGSLLIPALTLYDTDGTTVLATSSVEEPPAHVRFTLPRTGTYFVRVEDAEGRGSPDFSYSLTLEGRGAPVEEAGEEIEPNDDVTTATPMAFGNVIAGQISVTDVFDVDRHFILFTPNAFGGYDVEVIDFRN